MDERFAVKALEIGARIVASAVPTDRGIAWQDATRGEILAGFAYGASGVALFLLYLGVLARDRKYVVAATRAMEHEIAAASVLFPDGLPRWKANPKRNVWSPYWLSGGCGIGSVLVRQRSDGFPRTISRAAQHGLRLRQRRGRRPSE